jgi:molybdopterin synthase catalytic subunit
VSHPGRFAIVTEPLDAAALEALVADGQTGAVTTFVGRVRRQNAGRLVLWLEYEAYAPLAIASFERIAGEAAERWPGTNLAIAHRLGRLSIGDAKIGSA